MEGGGLFDCNLYTQPGRVIAHFVNLTSTGRMPIDELIPAGPVKVTLKLPRGVRGSSVKMLVSANQVKSEVANDIVQVTIPSILDHEVLVIE